MKLAFVGVLLLAACPSPRERCGGDGQGPCEAGCHAGLRLDAASGLCSSCGYELGPCCGGTGCNVGRTCMDGLGRATSPICATAPACDPGGTGPGAVGSACLDDLWCCPGLACLAGTSGELRCQPNPGTCWSTINTLSDGGTRYPDGGYVNVAAVETGPCFLGAWCCPSRATQFKSWCDSEPAGSTCVLSAE